MNQEINVDAVQNEYNKLVKLYSQISDLELDIKGIKETLKLEGVNPSLVAKIAKASVKGDKDKLQEGADSLLELLEVVK